MPRHTLRDPRIAAALALLVAVTALWQMRPESRAPLRPAVETTPSTTATTPSARFAPPSTPAASPTSPAKGLVARAAVDHRAALRLGLASQDEATRIAAVEAAVGATAIETLGDLQKFELARDPEAAPTVIHGVALLGASAEGAKREEAASTLSRWLSDERKREGADVAGNLSNLVEALGDVGGRRAVDALTSALDRADLALHVETLAIMKLGELGDARARGSVERFARRVAALPPADGIDEELRVEAIAAAATTLTKI